MSQTFRATTVKDAFSFIEQHIVVPDAFKDGVTLEIMSDPVTANDGLTYDRETAQSMVTNRSKSSKGMVITSFFDNQNVKTLLTDYLISQGVDVMTIFNNVRNSKSTLIEYVDNSDGTKTFNVSTISEILNHSGPKTCHAYVLDVSGSMGENSGIKEFTFTRLDVVKYAMYLSIKAINSGDEIIVSVFSSSGRNVVNRTVVTDLNRQNIIDSVFAVQASGGTNIISGLKCAADAARGSSATNIFYHVFTDGQDGQPDSINRNYRNLVSTNPSVKNNVAVYGFSSAADIDCIKKMEDNIPFYFISDVSMLITGFFNGFANANERHTIDTSEIDIVLRVTISDLKKIVKTTVYQSRQIDLDRLIMTLKTLKESPDTNEPSIIFIDGLLLDLEDNVDSSLGQVYKAVSVEYFKEWGYTYLCSYLNSMINKICVNYKDNGLKIFVTPERQAWIDRCERVVDENDLPKFINELGNNRSPPSYQLYGSGYTQPMSTSQLSYASMNYNIYNNNGGCFTSDSLVTVKLSYKTLTCDELLISIRDVSSDMLVKTNKGWSKILCKTVLSYSGKVYNVVDNVFLTPYHPVIHRGVANFPIDLNVNILDYTGDVYDLLLDDRGLIMIGCETENYHAASLNHDCQEGIFKHPYFGTTKIQNDLTSLSIFEVKVENYDMVRDVESGEVVGLDLGSIGTRNVNV